MECRMARVVEGGSAVVKVFWRLAGPAMVAGVLVGLLASRCLAVETPASMGQGGSLAELTGLPLNEALQVGLAAYQERRYVEAAALLAEFEAVFGAEREAQARWAEWLPRWADSALRSGQPRLAAEVFGRFLATGQGQPEHRAAAFFGLAVAREQSGDWDGAVGVYQGFLETFPGRPEVYFAVFQQAEALRRLGREQEGFEQLMVLARSPSVSAFWQAQASWRGLQVAAESWGLATASRASVMALLEFFLGAPEMVPEPGAMRTVAQRLAGRWMTEGNAEAAWLAWQLVWPDAAVERAEGRRLSDLGRALGGSTPPGQTGDRPRVSPTLVARLSEDHLRRWEARLRAAADQRGSLAEGAERGARALSVTVGRGETLLHLGRAREAWVLWSDALASARFSVPQRAALHYRWLLAAYDLAAQTKSPAGSSGPMGAAGFRGAPFPVESDTAGDGDAAWGEVVAVAEAFQRDFPDDPQLPAAGFIQALAEAGRGAHEASVALLSRLLVSHPEHPLAPRWLLVRGLTRVQATDYPLSIEDFTAFIDRYPGHPDAVLAGLWRGIVLFFQGDYPAALQALLPLQKELAPQTSWRSAVDFQVSQTLYALQRYADALTEVERFLGEYPEGAQFPAAQVLRGDLLLALSRPAEAVAQWQAVSRDAGALHAYAVFQIGDVLRGQGAFSEVAELYQAYLDGFQPATDAEVPEGMLMGPIGLAPEPPGAPLSAVPGYARLAEATYWRAWAWQQLGQPARAAAGYFDGLSAYAGNPHQGEVGQLLQGLERLHRSATGTAAWTESEIDTVESFFAARFSDWLAAQVAEARRLAENAAEGGELSSWTRWSRLRLFPTPQFPPLGPSGQADPLGSTGQGSRLAPAAVMAAQERITVLQVAEAAPLESLDAPALAVVGLHLLDLGSASAETYFAALLRRFPRDPAVGAAHFGSAWSSAVVGDVERSRRHLRRFFRDTPAHPLAGEAALLQAELGLATGDPVGAIDRLDSLAGQPTVRGHLRARALLLRARAETSLGQPERAIAAYQRVYTLYRAFPDLLRPAYLESARLFAQLGDEQAARRSLEELLGDPRLAEGLSTAGVAPPLGASEDPQPAAPDPLAVRLDQVLRGESLAWSELPLTSPLHPRHRGFGDRDSGSAAAAEPVSTSAEGFRLDLGLGHHLQAAPPDEASAGSLWPNASRLTWRNPFRNPTVAGDSIRPTGVEPETAAEIPAEAIPIDVGLAQRLSARPHRLVLAGGQVWSGQALRLDATHLSFQGNQGNLSLPRGRITSLHLPAGALSQELSERVAAGDFTRAVALATAIYRHRLPFLDLAPIDDLAEMLPVITLNLEHGDPYLALGAARRLRRALGERVPLPEPTLSDAMEGDLRVQSLPSVVPDGRAEGLAADLRDLEVLAAYRLPIRSDAWDAAYAVEGAASSRGSTERVSAVAPYILARLLLDADLPEAALRMALGPTVDAQAQPARYLAESYLVAIEAALRLGDGHQATALARDFVRRRLPIPSQHPHLAAQDFLDQFAPRTTSIP